MDTNKGAKPEKSLTTFSDETAQEHLDALCEYYDVKPADLPEHQREAIEPLLVRLKSYIAKGLVVIDQDKWEITHNLSSGKSITYKEYTGKAAVEMGKRLETDAIGRICALMGSLAGVTITPILDFKKKDLKIIEAIATVFLA